MATDGLPEWRGTEGLAGEELGEAKEVSALMVPPIFKEGESTDELTADVITAHVLVTDEVIAEETKCDA